MYGTFGPTTNSHHTTTLGNCGQRESEVNRPDLQELLLLLSAAVNIDNSFVVDRLREPSDWCFSRDQTDRLVQRHAFMERKRAYETPTAEAAVESKQDNITQDLNAETTACECQKS
ncbi:hypothetical protein MAPG_07344 [Magnaporthiopsis poae ATCC 64411]|uniref:Uncharacterized protein n=1 Tax=Magnaporthiopsis poae (strain ATCC 64411 / 73-15) TaxID=644358 RepID=A0A0C4E4F1_MAGP6|nr:hypothetical protein MAPG_07344 [Magnaporthiopsis poae ATCC 64411]